MREGLIDQDKKFKKRIASVDISNYKLVKRNELVVGFPIDEGVLGFQTKYDFAAVSPAYDVWKIKREDIPVTYLESILRSSPAIAKFKSAMKGTANRRRVVPKDEFLKIRIPMMNLETVTKITKMIETKQMENRKYLQIIEENNASIKKIVDESWN